MVILSAIERMMVYPACRYPEGDWEAVDLPHEDVFFKSLDGTSLHGWYLDHHSPRAYLLYCHGNGTSVAKVSPWIDVLRERLGVAAFVFDYRGYGRSQGKPDEAGVVADSQAARVWLSERAGLRPENIILMGRSLGGGVAVQLAANCPPPLLILENTFPSLTDVAALQMWWAPVHLVMRNRYDSLRHIQQYHGPLIQAHGEQDSLVPIQMGRRLFNEASGPKQFIAIPEAGHNTAFPPWYLNQLDHFIQLHL